MITKFLRPGLLPAVLLLIALALPISVSAAPGDNFDNCAAAGLGAKGSNCDQVTNCATDETNAFNPSGECFTNLPKVYSSDNQIRNGLKIAFGVAAGIALISLAIGAFNYATVATDPDKITRAKMTIIFSLIGLIIALAAEAIVIVALGEL